MIDYSSRLVEYCEQHSKFQDAILEELIRVTHLQTTQPRMLSGPLQGLFLQMLCSIHQPKHVLEIGTFTGYSAICMAKGLPENGKLTTIDMNPETMVIARDFIHRSGLDHKIRLREGNALEIIPTLEETFDFVFIDADKENYAQYYQMVKMKVPKGGLIILDNMLWSGKVLDEAKDARTKAIDALNELIVQDQDMENILLPIRDGLHIARVR